MHTSALQQRLATYKLWKTRVARAIAELETWLDLHRRATPRAREQLLAAAQTLAVDRLTVAIVGEQAGARTDLINALFFSGLAMPLLPTVPSGTAPCTTELWWDGGRGEAYLRLLPVETRAQDRSQSFRTPPGHPEGYLEGFANIYAEAARAILARREGAAPDPAITYPGLKEGLEGVAFVDACVRSSRRNGAWVKLAL